MSRIIIHHEGWLFDWSTITDSPASEAIRVEDVGAEHEEWLSWTPERVARAIQNGSSALPPATAEEMIAGNRAGPGETRLSMQEIMDKIKPPCPPSPTSKPSTTPTSASNADAGG